MRLRHLVARGFRNLADLECEPPAAGVAILGANAQGKTNLLEAVYYPVLFRSLRGAADAEVLRVGEAGFRVEAVVGEGRVGTVAATYVAAGRRKRILVDGEEPGRLADAVGGWLAVAFLPADVGLAGGPAAERRQYLDRLLSLADARYLRALTRYRAALVQRNSALRQDRPELAEMFDPPLASAGAEVTTLRERWAESAAEQFRGELACIGEGAEARLRYRGDPALGDPAAWPAALGAARGADRARGMTTVGPHRHDLVLEIGGRPLREYGSTGQQRSAAVALKLIEIATLRAARGTEPALLLDDVFAELDRERQGRLARRLLGEGERQVFITAPRPDELPAELGLEVWRVREGRLER
ncbi:MAG TPA: DNA replication and repair protein RecF [Gemmatimonadales bacterium]|nr:DNA replication and repair protein RecF [Gemmatimonadales bacterium]